MNVSICAFAGWPGCITRLTSCPGMFPAGASDALHSGIPADHCQIAGSKEG